MRIHPLVWVLIIGVGITVPIAVLASSRKKSPYDPSRQYVITGWDFSIMSRDQFVEALTFPDPMKPIVRSEVSPDELPPEALERINTSTIHVWTADIWEREDLTLGFTTEYLLRGPNTDGREVYYRLYARVREG